MNGQAELIKKYTSLNGIEITEQQAEMLASYMDFLIEYNKKVNLTAITAPEEIAVKHFADSLVIADCLRKRASDKCSLIDIGSGAGFPGIPLAIVMPDLSVTMVDSVRKKTDFIAQAVQMLGLKNAKAVCGRAEELAALEEHRERYDFSTARAVASMPVLLEYCTPFIRKNGHFIAMKGPDAGNEPCCDRALKEFGCVAEEKAHIFLNGLSDTIERNIFIFKKEKNTSSKYPRMVGKAAKSPII